jgi:hypothetical protein
MSERSRIVRIEATSTTIHEADLDELKRLYPQHWEATGGNERAFARLCWLHEVDGPWDELEPEVVEPEVLFRNEPGPEGQALGDGARF